MKHHRPSFINAANPHLRVVARQLYAKAYYAGKIRPRSLFCESCKKVGRVEGHHPDYAQPYYIIWLCKTCHTNWHFPQAGAKRLQSIDSKGFKLSKFRLTCIAGRVMITQFVPAMTTKLSKLRPGRRKITVSCVLRPETYEWLKQAYPTRGDMSFVIESLVQKLKDGEVSIGTRPMN